MIRLAVCVRREQAELVLAELLELAPTGVEEVQIGDRSVEYAVYGAPGELPSLPDLDAIVGDALVEISTTEISDDWHERWKEFHRPVLIDAPVVHDLLGRPAGREPQPPHGGPPGRRPGPPAIRVRPPWEPPSADRSAAPRP